MRMGWRTIVAVGAMAMALAGCGEQTHRLVGAFILNDPGVDYSDSTCSGTGAHVDIKEGLGVIVRDEAGKAIGAAELVYDSRSSASQCLYTWEMTLGDAQSYSIEVGHRDAGTYTVEDLNRRYWQVATTVPEVGLETPHVGG
jgi:hypothetical protein